MPVVTLLSSNPDGPFSFEITFEFTAPHISDMAAATPAADLRAANDPQAMGVTPHGDDGSDDMVELLGAIDQGPFMSE